MKRLFAAALLVSAASFTSQLFAQAPSTAPAPDAAAPPIRFDVVSFRKCAQIDQVHKTTILPPKGDSIGRHCQSMLALFDFAYGGGRAPHEVKEEPDWADTEAWDFQAKVAPADVPAWQAMDLDTKRLMVRAVLVDRLKLQVDTQTRPRPVYNLVVGKGGPKLTPSKLDPGQPAPNDVNWAGNEEAVYVGETMPQLANGLSARLDRNVVDKTGLTGAYDFHVKGLPYYHYNPKAAGEPPDLTPIFDGVKELGLELVPSTESELVIVVNHIERPSAN